MILTAGTELNSLFFVSLYMSLNNDNVDSNKNIAKN